MPSAKVKGRRGHLNVTIVWEKAIPAKYVHRVKEPRIAQERHAASAEARAMARITARAKVEASTTLHRPKDRQKDKAKISMVKDLQEESPIGEKAKECQELMSGSNQHGHGQRRLRT